MQVEVVEEECEKCGQSERHVHVEDDDFEFTACGRCGDKLKTKGYRRSISRRCEECKQYESHIHYNTSTTGVKMGHLQTKKHWICVGCGHRD